MFTYTVKRAKLEKVLRTFPKMKQYAGMGFDDFMRHRKPENEMAGKLLGDTPEFGVISQKMDWTRHGPEFTAMVEHSLRRMDIIYACSNQEVLDDLNARGFIPQAKEVWENKSAGNIDFGRLGSRQAFLETLNHLTWLDTEVFKAAQRLFPGTVRTPLASDEEILSEVESRFGARFQD